MRVLAILSIAGIIAFSGCSGGATRSTNAVGLRNSELEQTARTKLAAEPQLAIAIRVSANADTNSVTLSGTVPSEQLRSEAVELVKASRNGLIVTDTIAVRPLEVPRNEYTEDMAREAREKAKIIGDKIGATLNDAWLYTKITAKLIGNSETPVRKINVDVFDGVVTLRGEVETTKSKEEAERIARDTEGVRRVRNLLKVAVAVG